MKRLLSLLMASALILVILTGCAGSNDFSDGESAVELSFTSGAMTQDSQNGYAMGIFADKVEEYSNGSITVNLFYDTQLGDAASQVQSVKQGTLDMVVAGISYFSTYAPEIEALQLPFMFSGYDEAHAAVDGEAGDYAKEQFNGTGLKILGIWDIGFRQLTNSVRPVESMADVAGLKLRTLPSTYQVAAWESFGALPTAIDYSELYQSLQTGLVVGQENPISEIVSQKFYEIQPYMSMTYHCYTPSPVAISETTWNELTAEQQEAVEKAMVDATAACREKLTEIEEEGLTTMEESGVQIVMEPDLSGFQEKTPETWELFTADCGDTLVNMLSE